MHGSTSGSSRMPPSGGDGRSELQAIPLYLAMSYLYKRSNRFWHLLIKHDLVNPVWKPLVEMTRWRHVHYRRKLARSEEAVGSGQVVSAGV